MIMNKDGVYIEGREVENLTVEYYQVCQQLSEFVWGSPPE